MAFGPVEVAIIGFPGNKFTGKVAPAIADLVQSGTVRILDLLFVSKDVDGTIASFAVADLDGDLQPDYVGIEIHEPGALGAEDADEIADDLDPNSSVLLIAWENTWAVRLVTALREADAFLIDRIQIPAEIVDAALPHTV